MNTYYENPTQGHCPKCGKEIINWCDSMSTGEYIDLYFVCECGLHGCETYKLAYQVAMDDEAA